MSVFPSDEAAYAVGIVLGILIACVVLGIIGYCLYKKWGLSALEDDDEELAFLKQEVGRYEAPSHQEREARLSVADRPGTQQATRRRDHEVTVVVGNPLRDEREAAATTMSDTSPQQSSSPMMSGRGSVAIEDPAPHEGISTSQVFPSRPRFMTAAHVAKVVRRASSTTGGTSSGQGKAWKF